LLVFYWNTIHLIHRSTCLKNVFIYFVIYFKIYLFVYADIKLLTTFSRCTLMCIIILKYHSCYTVLRCSPLSSRNLKVSDALPYRSYGLRPSVLHNSTTVNGTETFTDSGFIAITAVLNMVASTSKSSRRAIKRDVTDVVLDLISLRRVAWHVLCVLYLNCLFVHWFCSNSVNM